MKVRLATVFIALIWCVSAQTGRPSFEVASVKPSDTRDGSFTFNYPPGGGFTARNCTLRLLIQLAWDIKDYQLPNSPAWISANGFDIAAKPGAGGGDVSRKDSQQMLQTLLMDRFHLTVHRETAQRPVYSLVVGKNGSKLGAAGSITDPMVTRIGELVVSKMPMSALATILGFDLKRPVLDETGLNGDFAFRLQWAPGLGDSGAEPSSKPSLFVAVQEQLGLKLSSTTGPVEVLVIDHVEKPSAN